MKNPMRRLIQIVEGVDLIEAPIGNLEVHKMDEPGTFPDADRKLLTNPAHIQKIRKKFEKTPYLFNLYFVNKPSENLYVNKDGKFTDTFQTDLENYNGFSNIKDEVKELTGLDVVPDPSAITVVFVSNANSINSVNMTPWMVAHRIGHAMSDAFYGDWNAVLKKLNKEFLTMRSARQDQLNDGDGPVELVAQYLMQGKITIKIPDDYEIIRDKIEGIRDAANNLIKNGLDKCVGRILISI